MRRWPLLLRGSLHQLYRPDWVAKSSASLIGSPCFNTTLMKNMRQFGVLLLLSCVSLQLHARPYATSLTNESGNISFRLNESADSVKVISAGGTATNDLGALAAGLHTFPLSITGPYQIEVF